MRPSLPVLVAVAACVLAAAAFAGVGRPEAARGDTPAPGTVTTVGHGDVLAVPDEATVSAGVETRGATASAALAQNASLMARVIAALKGHGGKNVQTEQVSLTPQTNARGDVTGYVADNSVSADAPIVAAGALIDAAVGAGANTVSGPTLSVSTSDADYRQALAKAVADARAKAQALGQAGGFAVGAVSSVTEQSAAPVETLAPAAMSAAKSATPVEPGTQDITADVSVTFQIG
jgi:uncharacterized protein